jgi:hypothetical protein
MQSSSSVVEQTIGNFSKDPAVGSYGRPLRESKGTYFPSDTHETDENAKKRLTSINAIHTKGSKTHPYS